MAGTRVFAHCAPRAAPRTANPPTLRRIRQPRAAPIDDEPLITRAGEPPRVCADGVDSDELWFRATVLATHRNDVGQWVDVRYDDGDIETMKPIKRVKALAPESDEEDD